MGRQPVSERMRSHRFVRALDEALAGRLNYEIGGRVMPGEIRADTERPNGFSLRVHSPTRTRNGVSVMDITGSAPDRLQFNQKRKMIDYLEGGEEVVDRLSWLVQKLGGDMIGKGYDARTTILLSRAHAHAAEFARIAAQLADLHVN